MVVCHLTLAKNTQKREIKVNFMKIRIKKSSDKNIGALRVSDKVFKRLEEIAKKEGVSKQEIIRAILDEMIDKVEF